MSLLSLLVAIALIGFILYVLLTYIPMDGTVKGIIKAVAIISIIVFVLYALGLWDKAKEIKVPHF